MDQPFQLYKSWEKQSTQDYEEIGNTFCNQETEEKIQFFHAENDSRK